MTSVIRPPYNGVAAQIVIHRYFILLNCCGGIALLHLLLETLYSGKAVERLTLGAVIAVLVLSLAGGFWLQPKLRTLHVQKYSQQVSAETRAVAGRSFKLWHGVSQTMNLFVIGGLLIYLWRVSNPPNTTRFTSATKFRG